MRATTFLTRASSPDGRPPAAGPSLTTWSLAALAASLLLGVLGHTSGHPAFLALADAVQPLGNLWVTALQMTVVPLVVVHTLAAIVGAPGGESVGTLGARAVLLFVVMLGAAGLATYALAPLVIERYAVDPAMVASLHAATQVPEGARATAGASSLGEWISSLLNPNLIEAARRGDILPLLLFTALFAVAVTRLPAETRDPLARVFRGLADAMMLCVRWILRATPVGVFAVTYAFAVRTGGGAAGMLGVYVVIISGFMLLFTVLLYPVSTVLGRARVGPFARALAPAQLVAVSTRSSIAALPALIEGGRRHLGLPASASSFVLPLSASLFKINRTISSPIKLLFLAHVYGIPLAPAQLATFLLTVILLSFSTVGLPGGGQAFKTMPAYLAAGVPIEGVVIMEAVETIPDIFKTLLNVTGYMSVATLLTRRSRTAARGAPERAPIPNEAQPVAAGNP